jgi:hypothetical protein
LRAVAVRPTILRGEPLIDEEATMFVSGVMTA